MCVFGQHWDNHWLHFFSLSLFLCLIGVATPPLTRLQPLRLPRTPSKFMIDCKLTSVCYYSAVCGPSRLLISRRIVLNPNHAAHWKLPPCHFVRRPRWPLPPPRFSLSTHSAKYSRLAFARFLFSPHSASVSVCIKDSRSHISITESHATRSATLHCREC